MLLDRQLSDTTKSGHLFFPEFALAMYLCNLRRQGKPLPSTLPEVIRNEVGSMVDIISFGIPDSNPPAPAPSNAPSFEVSVSSRQNVQTPTQSQASNTTLLGMNSTSQPTSFQPQAGFSGLISQQTGFSSQPTGIISQPTGMMAQRTGVGAGMGGFSGSIPPVPPIPIGLASLISPLQAQATGRPGQWGFVNAPATGLPGIEALQQQMMPQPGRASGFSMQGLQGNATIPWAVTKVEKQLYDKVFDGWDGLGKGFIGGDVAIEVFGQSGLPKENLMQIWTLADPTNKGKLNKDEFAVAMHLARQFEGSLRFQF